MSHIMAIFHVFGALGISAAGSIYLFLRLTHFSSSKSTSITLEMAIKLGIASDEIDTPHNHDVVMRYLTERYSGDLFQNRLSDLVGTLLLIWSGLFVLVYLCFFGWSIYVLLFDNIEYISLVWLIVPVTVFYWLMHIVVNKLSTLLFARAAGEAFAMRHFLQKDHSLKSMEMSNTIDFTKYIDED